MAADMANFRDGDWMCACGAHNYASKAACFKCQTPKAFAQAGGLGQQAGMGQMQLGLDPSMLGMAGMGGMGGMGFGGAGYGNPGAVAQPAAPPAGVANFRPGDWMCSCGAHNYQSKAICFKCHTPKGFANNNLLGLGAAGLGVGGMAGMQALMGLGSLGGAPAGGAVPNNFRPGDWMCMCGNHNYASRGACGKCHTPKATATNPLAALLGPAALGPMGAQSNLPGNFREGDWMCKCGNHNYGSRVHCGKCQVSKEEGNRPLEELKPVPADFRVGDWMCPACNNHNYASRVECKKCSAGRPVPADGQPPSIGPTRRSRSRSPQPGGERDRSRSPPLV